ncbi:DUF2484 family protein [Phaeobacter sp. 22II1-1F12B]|uniref:DUF2484 family protein n=1 Tax=Phaeobacter sp. 22II1-1F12B TaxID=1317111 RepID=UPI000B5241FB|nr:DUF2484 family protein [Phaeobacter sp. 22II1-1F12B]OWU80519.1 UDP-N-acetylmuramate--alanine ligase [Phaeobacter sp. 22II1-1F12B]
MNAVILVAVLWVFAATAVALLPMRLQMIPGLALLIAAPALIGAITLEFGWLAGIAGLAGFLSMFRHPLRYFWRKWRGQETGVPE